MPPLANVTAPVYATPFLKTHFANSLSYEVTTFLLKVANYSEAFLLNIEPKNLLIFC